MDVKSLNLASAWVSGIAEEAARISNELCGLLGGEFVGPTLLTTHAVPLTNRSLSPDRFFVTSADYYSALGRLREAGVSAFAVYHSHAGLPSPSFLDIESMRYQDLPWVILGQSGATRKPRVASFVMVKGRVTKLRHTLSDRDMVVLA